MAVLNEMRSASAASDQSPHGPVPRSPGPPAGVSSSEPLDQVVQRALSADLLGRTLICPVFTAHPSEARRRAILEKLEAISRQLDRLEYTRLLPTERERAVAAIEEAVETFWLTDTVRADRPSVLDEVRQGLDVVESSLLDVIPRVYRELEAALRRVYPGRTWRVPAFLRFGSWIGGDRDGNP